MGIKSPLLTAVTPSGELPQIMVTPALRGRKEEIIEAVRIKLADWPGGKHGEVRVEELEARLNDGTCLILNVDWTGQWPTNNVRVFSVPVSA